MLKSPPIHKLTFMLKSKKRLFQLISNRYTHVKVGIHWDGIG